MVVLIMCKGAVDFGAKGGGDVVVMGCAYIVVVMIVILVVECVMHG